MALPLWAMAAILACGAASGGCATTVAGMVVKHVVMSTAKDVALDQYKKIKERNRKPVVRPAGPDEEDSARDASDRRELHDGTHRREQGSR